MVKNRSGDASAVLRIVVGREFANGAITSVANPPKHQQQSKKMSSAVRRFDREPLLQGRPGSS
jgi:hypothetical protein